MTTGSTMISTTSSRLPPISTSSTPARLSIFSLRSREILSRVRSGTGPASETVNTGNNATFISCTTGSSVSAGRLDFAMSTFSRTSASAVPASKPASNSSVTEPWLSVAVLVMSLTPAMLCSSVSIGRINSRSLSSGEIPSWFIDT